MKKLLFIIGILLVIGFTVGAIQSYTFKPLGNCRKSDTAFTSPNGSHYQPYNCNDETKYIIK